jgi:hypothetical protein
VVQQALEAELPQHLRAVLSSAERVKALALGHMNLERTSQPLQCGGGAAAGGPSLTRSSRPLQAAQAALAGFAETVFRRGGAGHKEQHGAAAEASQHSTAQHTLGGRPALGHEAGLAAHESHRTSSSYANWKHIERLGLGLAQGPAAHRSSLSGVQRDGMSRPSALHATRETS